MSSKADKLGRGAAFGAAVPVSARRAAIAAATKAPTSGIAPGELPLRVISENPENPREVLTNIETMADTFESVGQLTAITVATAYAYLAERPERAGDLEPGAEYVVVDGHRRLAAARLLGWDTIRVMLDDAQVASDESLLEAAFVANTQREDMTDLEEAEALRKLVAFYGSQSKTAKRLGMSQAKISQRLSLLALSPELQADLNAGTRKVEHVRGLASLPPEAQRAKADERAAAARNRPAADRPIPAPSSEPPAQEPSTPSGYNGVIGRAPEEPAGTVPPAPATAPVPAPAPRPEQRAMERPTPVFPVPQQPAEEPGDAYPPAPGEPDWAGDQAMAEILSVGRYLAATMAPDQRQRLGEYLLAVSQEPAGARA